MNIVVLGHLGAMGKKHYIALTHLCNNIFGLDVIEDVKLCCEQYMIEKILQIQPKFVVVATPPKTHFKICKILILNGINVLCEKPLTLSYKDDLNLLKLAKDNNTKLMINFQHSNSITSKLIQELIQDGFSDCSINFEISRPITYYTNSTWRHKQNDGGDIVRNQLIHILFLFSEMMKDYTHLITLKHDYPYIPCTNLKAEIQSHKNKIKIQTKYINSNIYSANCTIVIDGKIYESNNYFSDDVNEINLYKNYSKMIDDSYIVPIERYSNLCRLVDKIVGGIVE